MNALGKPSREEIKLPDRPKLADVLGPGLITGASDDDPSGIATYSQAGAQYGYSLGWTLLLTYPLMCAIQMISAEIGRYTDDPQLQQWINDEVARPLDATEVAKLATDPAIAAQMYLASVMVVDDQQDAERNYLDELAAALKIDPELQVHLEQQAKGGAA